MLQHILLLGVLLALPVEPARADDGVSAEDQFTRSVIVQSHPLRTGLPVTTRTVSADGMASQSARERLVYSNRLGNIALTLPPNLWVADDLTLIAGPGCKLSRFAFFVTGNANPEGATGAYRVDFALYDNCPQAGRSEIIPGTQGSIEVLDSTAIVRVEHLVPQESEIELPPTVWLAVKFSRSNVGFIGGAPALAGYSSDRVDFPGSACNADAGGYPNSPHASFNAEVYVRDDCPHLYPGYRSFNPARDGFNVGPRVCFADDIELTTDSCDMVALEFGVRLNGITPVASVQTRLFEDAGGLPGSMIEGTHRTATLSNGPGGYVVRQSFDPPIPLPGKRLWAAYESAVLGAGWILTRSTPDLGSAATSYARSHSGRRCSEMATNPDWELTFPPDFSAFGAFEATVYCAGDQPVGACCDPIIGDEFGDTVCREVPKMNCPFPSRIQLGGDYPEHWIKGAICTDEPFEFACGTYACCMEDRHCQNLTAEECDSLEPEEAYRIWHVGRECGDEIEDCRLGNCATGRLGPNCRDNQCPDAVCRVDRWCCSIAWDDLCVRRSQSYCEVRPYNWSCDSRRALGDHDSVFVQNADVVAISTGLAVSCHDERPGFPPPGVTWYGFVATAPSARIDTCNTFPPLDTVISIFAGQTDPSPSGQCPALNEIACVNAEGDCPNGGSSVCVDGLIPGDAYYIQLASSDEFNQGAIQLEITMPCPTDSILVEVGTTLLADPLSSRSEEFDRQPRKSRTDVVYAPERHTSDILPSQNEIPELLPVLAPRPSIPPLGVVAHSGAWIRDGFESIQVNVNSMHLNIPGDAANEPSITVDPVKPNRMAIGWRQFDSVNSDFRQAGYAYTEDSGRTWTFPGVIDPGVFRSDPVLDSNAEGVFYYYSLTSDFTCDLFTSFDGGKTWPQGISAYGGDKGWIAVDRVSTVGKGNIYASWTGAGLTRSVDGGASFENPVPSHAFQWGTIAVGPQGEVYVTSDQHVSVSYNAADPNEVPGFSELVDADLGGRVVYGASPNPDGIVGQTWIAVDTSNEPTRGNVYRLASVRPYAPSTDPLDVMFTRSEDGGYTWSVPVRVNDDLPGNGAWQWFGTMSVAPNGRIDAIWNDTRNTGEVNLSELYYTYSYDAGHTWAKNIPVSPMFDSWVGWPQQDKLGDYYHMVSDNTGASVAYAATFNGEQDVYYLRIGEPIDCNQNDVPDLDDILVGGMPDCDSNSTPDECQSDLDADGSIDACDDDIDDDGVENGEDVCPRNRPNMIVDDHGAPRADTTGRCNVDLGDYWRFRNCMLNGRPGAPAPREACLNAFDVTGDEVIDLADFQGFQTSFSGTR